MVVPAGTRVLSFVTLRTPGQQNGVIASFGQGLLVTDRSWKCTNETFKNNVWATHDYSDHDWPNAHEFCNNSVPVPPITRVEGIAGSAKWIWSRDQNATEVYCRRLL